jgi:uncharacterized membrane protein YdcZ (DUF606 family)
MSDGAEQLGGRPRRGWRLAAWSIAAALILLPLVAMRFTDEVDWTPADFAFAGALVLGVGLTYELTVRTTASRAYRTAVGVALAAALLLIWINGAVGIIGSEDHPANRMYGGVLAVGIIGAVVVRFRAYGMARVLVAVALAQLLVAVIALVAGFGFTGPITVFFSGLWLASAWLFEKAAKEQRPTGETLYEATARSHSGRPPGVVGRDLLESE